MTAMLHSVSSYRGLSHWLASYTFALLAVFFTVTSMLWTEWFLDRHGSRSSVGDVIGSPHAGGVIATQEKFLSVSGAGASDTTAVDNLSVPDSGSTTSTAMMVTLAHVDLDQIPLLPIRGPILFSFMVHSLLMLWIPVYYIFSVLRRVLRLPRSSTFSRRLATGRSRIGRIVGNVAENFSDRALESCVTTVSFKGGINAVGAFGLLSASRLLYQVLSVYASHYAALPLSMIVRDLYVLAVPILGILLLKQTTNFARLVIHCISFFGIFIFYFGGATDMLVLSGVDGQQQFTPGHSIGSIMRCLLLSLSSMALWAIYLVGYKALNPPGWMTKILGYQGLYTFLYGLPFMALVYILRFEVPTFPLSWLDWKLLLGTSFHYSISLYCCNEAVRWGDPSGLASALLLAIPLGWATNAPLDVLTFKVTSKDMGLLLTLIGFVAIAICHAKDALRNSKTRKHPISEVTPLVYGQDYQP